MTGLIILAILLWCSSAAIIADISNKRPTPKPPDTTVNIVMLQSGKRK
jgi:hypothetical protein